MRDVLAALLFLGVILAPVVAVGVLFIATPSATVQVAEPLDLCANPVATAASRAGKRRADLMADVSLSAAPWSTPCPGGCGQPIAICACDPEPTIPGAWRCEVCGTWIEMRDPRPWPDHCGQRAEWITAVRRTREAQRNVR